MSFKWDWWKGEETLDVDALRAEFGAINALVESDGWKWLVERLVETSNTLAAEWMKGNHDLAKHESLAGQTKLIGEILDWPNARAKEISDALKAERVFEADQQREADEETSLSPMPDESPDYPDE